MLLATSGCFPEAYPCTTDENCGEGAVCAAPGYCAFDDERCESGLRYGKHSPPALAHACVDPNDGDPDSPSDSSEPTTDEGACGCLDDDGQTSGGDATSTAPSDDEGEGGEGSTSGGHEVPPPPGQCGNGVLDAGENCDDGNAISGDGCSASCDHAGEHTVLLVFDEDDEDRCSAIAPTADGGALVVGSTQPVDGPEAALLLRIDAAGMVLWIRRDQQDLPTTALDVAVGPVSGSAYVVGTRGSGIGPRVHSRRVSADGDPLWDDISFVAVGGARGVAVDADESSVFIVGSVGSNENETAIALRKSASTGQSLVHYGIGFAGRLQAAVRIDAGDLFAAGFARVSNAREAVLLRIDVGTDDAVAVVHGAAEQFTAVAYAPQGPQLFTGGFRPGTGQDAVLAVASPQTLQLTEFSATGEVGDRRVSAVVVGADGEYVAAGVRPDGDRDEAFVERLDAGFDDPTWTWTLPNAPDGTTLDLAADGASVWACGTLSTDDGSDLWLARVGL